jgi:hypothetical protein
MGAYFPRISPDGVHVVAGNGRLELDGKDIGVVGWGPCWLNNDHILFNDGTHTSVISLLNHVPALVAAQGYSDLDAQGGTQWIGYRGDNISVEVSTGVKVPGAGAPSISQAGRTAWVNPRQVESKGVYLNGDRIWTGPALDLKVSDTCIAWSTPTSLFYKVQNGPVFEQPKLGVSLYRPVPIDTPSGPWIQCHTQQGIVLFQPGQTRGHYKNTNGQSYYPDARCVGDHILSVYTDVHGVLGSATFPLTPSVDLTTIHEGTPPPQPKPEPPPMPTRTNHLDLVTQVCVEMAALFPVGPERGFQILNKVCRELAGEGYGLLAKTSGNNYRGYSVDKIIQKDGTGVDILTGPNNDQPAWSEIVPVDPSAWREPAGPPQSQPDPVPVPAPQPVPVDLSPILSAIDKLAEAQKALQAAQAALDAKIVLLTNTTTNVAADVKAARSIDLGASFLGTLHGTVKPL